MCPSSPTFPHPGCADGPWPPDATRGGDGGRTRERIATRGGACRASPARCRTVVDRRRSRGDRAAPRRLDDPRVGISGERRELSRDLLAVGGDPDPSVRLGDPTSEGFRLASFAGWVAVVASCFVLLREALSNTIDPATLVRFFGYMAMAMGALRLIGAFAIEQRTGRGVDAGRTRAGGPRSDHRHPARGGGRDVPGRLQDRCRVDPRERHHLADRSLPRPRSGRSVNVRLHPGPTHPEVRHRPTATGGAPSVPP